MVLDPGHGGKDPGAVGNGLLEKDINLDLARRVAVKLSTREVEVTLTRSADIDLELSERADIANNLLADYFCSLHINAGGGTGFESYIHTNAASDTQNLRNIIHDKVAGFYNNAGFPDRGKKSANFAVLRETDMPAVLLENLFIDYSKDAAKLIDSSFLDGLAGAIASGLTEALTIPEKPPIEGPGKTPVKVDAAAKPFQALSLLLFKNPQAPDYVDIYVSMGAKYGVRWDAVFAQSCRETAYWKFGGIVKPEQNNFAGLATFDGKPGATFSTPAEGIEAQFQHWHVYYYGGELPDGAVNLDPRREAVIKSGWAGTLRYVEDLGGHWAPAADYGTGILNNYLAPMLAIQVPEPPPPAPIPVPVPEPAPEPAPSPSPAPEPTPAPPWDPVAEIAKLKADGLINSDHQPGEIVTWGKLATVINRLRGK
ncbi:MAG: N-acetylmuramoyl-L-alanine amidase [Eubacteriales bacterium]